MVHTYPVCTYSWFCFFQFGGYNGSERLADMYVYDFETNFWAEVDCTHGDCPSGRSSLVAQIYENSLYLFGVSCFCVCFIVGEQLILQCYYLSSITFTGI